MTMATLWFSCLLLLVSFGAFASGSAIWGNRKVDCGVSVWSNWKRNADGTRTRTRKILRQPQLGGDPCPSLTYTEQDPWCSTCSIKTKAVSMSKNFLQKDTIQPRDILFVVDTSGSIGTSDFGIAKQNIAKLVGKICGDVGLGVQQNRVAAITFSNRPQLSFDFNDHTSLGAVQTAITKMAYDGGGTCTGDALDYARKNIFVPSSGMRPDSQSVKEVVVLTDGVWNCGSDAITAAQRLSTSRSPPMSIFAFAIKILGQNDQGNIDALVSSPIANHLFTFANMDSFKDTVDLILTHPDNCAPIELK